MLTANSNKSEIVSQNNYNDHFMAKNQGSVINLMTLKVIYCINCT
jgi:hypothetical protein